MTKLLNGIFILCIISNHIVFLNLSKLKKNTNEKKLALANTKKIFKNVSIDAISTTE